MAKLREKSVLVTGGAGFIGSHLIDALVREKPRRLVAVDNFFLGRRENLREAEEAFDSLVVEEADASDLETMRQLILKHDVEVVFDLAVVPLPASLERPKWSVDQNVTIATTLCQLARDGCYETLIHFSSSEAFGTALEVPMSESHPIHPLTPYAASKAACDHIVQSFVRSFGIDAAILRPFNNYGPRQNDRAYAGIIPIVVRKVLAGEPIEIFGDGRQTRDFIYAADTAAAAIRMYETPATRGRVTAIASGEELAIGDLVAAILELLGAPNHTILTGPERPGDVRRHCADVRPALERMNFSPSVKLEEGLRRTLAWYREH